MSYSELNSRAMYTSTSWLKLRGRDKGLSLLVNNFEFNFTTEGEDV